MNTLKKLLSLTLAVVLLFGCMTTLISCGGNTGAKIDNESTRLVLSTSELDGVFNPFYSSSGPDGSVVGMTQIGMLSSDKDGKVAYGPDEPCVVLDYQTKTITEEDGSVKTVYTFVLKNNIQFSDGSYLTMKDVLFNLYVYLDPAYYGSSTIYSTDIVGLDEYRTQTENKKEQESFNATFDSAAAERIRRFLECYDTVKDENKFTTLTDAEMKQYLGEIAEMLGEDYDTVVEDYELAKKYFAEELKTDYTYSKGTAQDIKFLDKNGKEVCLSTDVEAFLYNEGFIKWDEKEKKFVYGVDEKACKTWTEEQAIEQIYDTYVPNDIGTVVRAWGTGAELRTRFALLEKQAYFDSIDASKRIYNISGIQFANRTTGVKVNNVEYGVPSYNADGSVKSGNEVLQITINDVDPKAIWNFAFTVAPMFYYSDKEVYKNFDYETNFGVEFGSIDFQDNAVKNPDRIGVPVGAGPYKATTRTGDSENVEAGTFWALNVVYFERNEYFLLGPAKIKYVNYQVVSTNLMLEALYSGDVHFVEPACKQENIDSINARKAKGEGFDSTSVMTNGYGYIGINASKVPDLEVRQAIMHAINTQYAVDYYLGYSYSIYRPMTRASWAYPKATDNEGQYYAFDESGKTSFDLITEAGYTKSGKKNAAGYDVYQKNGTLLKYTFTIAGESTDHPAYMALKTAAEILNKNGFDIEVKTDINALKKLNNGDLTVWAAAWGSGVDPDMYQVYHIDSTAGSTNNWGYNSIKANAGGKYDRELELVEQLSVIIDRARTTLNEKDRAKDYAEALDIVMQLAVELPTYQRSDLYAYNTDIIDVTTLTPKSELTPYNGPLSKLWEVSLNERN